jgi:hypothetical protein
VEKYFYIGHHKKRGDNYKNAKLGWGHFKIFFSKTTVPEKLRFT